MRNQEIIDDLDIRFKLFLIKAEIDKNLSCHPWNSEIPSMSGHLSLSYALSVVEQGGPPFLCPESNGFFPDPEQCDKYYECVGEVPEEKFCPDGLLFEASNPNNELCDYPFNVDCGAREYVRKLPKKNIAHKYFPTFCSSEEPEPGLDPRCYRANGFFNHEDPEVCNKWVWSDE